MELEINHIKKYFGRKEILCNITLSAQQGDCVGILGGNGCGKTTFLSILAGILQADSGSFILYGKDMFQDKKLRSRMIGYVPQGTPLFEELSAKDNLSLWYNKKDMEQELNDGVLSFLGIPDFLHVPVNKMSGGMKKRLSIGCAIAGKQPVLLLDEPTAALDLICKQQIWDYLEDYRKKGGIILLVTHDEKEIEMCNKCYLLKHGELLPYIFNGDIQQLIKQL